MQNEYTKKRDILFSLLKNADKINVEPIMPEGGFFLVAKVHPDYIEPSYLEDGSLDFAFCR